MWASTVMGFFSGINSLDTAPVRWDDKLITFRRSSCDLR